MTQAMSFDLERTTMTALFGDRTLCADQVARELDRLGDSPTPADCLLRNALLELCRLRTELAEERSLLDCLEELGLQTTSSIFGVSRISSPPGYVSRWMAWQGRKHTNLRDAVRETIQLRRPRGRR